MFRYGTASKVHLSGVTPRLRGIFEKAIELVNFQIVDGIRTAAEQAINIRNGASRTVDSRHLPQPPDNLSNAVDAVVYPLDYDILERGYNAVKRIDPGLRIFEHYWALGVLAGIALERGVPLRQGIDWNHNGEFEDQTFLDLPHNEIPRGS